MYMQFICLDAVACERHYKTNNGMNLQGLQCIPIMNCRDAHAFERKIKKAHAKKNKDLAERLQAMRPAYRLDHLVKERYGTTPLCSHTGRSV